MTELSTSDTGFERVLDRDAPIAVRILNCLSAVLDDNSIARLDEAIPAVPKVGRRCLELGAGNGSIAGWLAQYVGDLGEVTAVDIRPEYVCEHPGVLVLGLNVTCDELPAGPWDVVHARLLLAHQPLRHAILRRIVEVLAPGGVVVLEEWGQAGLGRVLTYPRAMTADLYRLYGTTRMKVYAEHGFDPSWCETMHDAMIDAGLTGVTTTTHARSWPAGTAGCDLPILLCTDLHDRLVGHGMDPADLARLQARLGQPTTVVLGDQIWTTTGYKPDQPLPDDALRGRAMPADTRAPQAGHGPHEESAMKHDSGQRVRVIAESIQRSNGAAWKDTVGTIVNVTGDGYQVDFDGTVLDTIRDTEVIAV